MKKALLENYYITIALARNNGGLNLSGSNGGREKWLDIEYILKIKSTALVML